MLNHKIIKFFDNTLRDGEQTPGLAFDETSKIMIAKALAKVGINAAEVGFPAVSADERNSIKSIVDLSLPMEVVGLCRPIEKDVDYAVDCGLKSIRLFLPKSKEYLVNQLRIDFNRLKYHIAKVIEYAVKKKLSVRFTFEDASRSQNEEVIKYFKLAMDTGASTVCFADTAGIMLPSDMFQRIKEIVENIDAPIAVHCHNDLGLATANTISAVQAGATELECCVNGLGERAGNAAFEEVIIILDQYLKIESSINLSLINKLSSIVSKVSGYQLLPNKPIVGEKVFQHESGIHVNSIILGEKIYEVFTPELIGRKHEVIFGKHSSLKVIELLLNTLNIPLTRNQQKALLSQVKLLTQQTSKSNTDNFVC